MANTLQTKLRNNKKPQVGTTSVQDPQQLVGEISDQASAGTPDKQMPEKESRKYLNQLQQLVQNAQSNPQFSSATNQQLKDLSDLQDKAQQLYQERANRNDWLEVAQTLGRAVTQFGAAAAGQKSGMDMSNLPQGAPIDYGGRTDRSLREYLGETGRLAGLRSEALRREEQNQRLGERSLERQGQYLGNAARVVSGEEEAAQRARTSKELEGMRLKGQEASARAADERARRSLEERDTRDVRSMTVKDITEKQKEGEKSLKAALTLFNNEGLADDLTNKSADKLEEQYGKLAAEAGISLPQLKSEMEQTDRPGRFFGTNPDLEARKALKDKKIAEAKNYLQALEQLKQQKLSGSQPQEKAPIQTGPRPGDVEGGYRFRGGDPKDQKNWESVK